MNLFFRYFQKNIEEQTVFNCLSRG